MRVASIGECMIELAGAGDGIWRSGFAGDTFNTLWTLRALLGDDAECDYLSAFGDDPFSTQQIGFFAASGIGIAESLRIAGARPGLYAITLTGAERSFTYWRNDAAARRLGDDDVALAKSLKDRALVYFSGITLAILEPAARARLLDAVAKARAEGSLVAFDPNFRPRLWPDQDEARLAIEQALAVTDIALPTFPDEQALFGDLTMETAATRLKAAGVREAAIKNGAEAALILHEERMRGVPAVAVTDPVDTTGAGDSFNGAYLAARLLGYDPLEAASRAHRVAGATVCVKGALAPFEVLRRAFG